MVNDNIKYRLRCKSNVGKSVFFPNNSRNLYKYTQKMIE